MNKNTNNLPNIEPLFKNSRKFRWFDILLLLFIGIFMALFYLFTQPVMSLKKGQIWDAVRYQKMIHQSAISEPLTADKPFVYRIGLPIMVGRTIQWFGGESTTIIKTYNFVFGMLGYLVLVLILFQLISHRGIVYLLAILYLTNYNSPFRFGCFYPFYVDPPATFVSLLIIYLNLIWDRLTIIRLLLLCFLAMVGVCFREYVLATLLASVFSHRIKFSESKPWVTIVSYRQLMLSLLPFVIGFITLVTIQHSVQTTGEYNFTEHALFSLRFKLIHLWIVPLAAFICYGPILLIGIFVDRTVWQKLLNQPMLLFFGLFVIGLTFLGGTHTQRFLYWGAPSYLTILGWILLQLDSRSAKKIIILSILLLFQVLAFRMFLPLPDIKILEAPAKPEILLLAPYGKNIHFFHIWTFLMPLKTQIIMLMQYTFLIIIGILLRFKWKIN